MAYFRALTMDGRWEAGGVTKLIDGTDLAWSVEFMADGEKEADRKASKISRKAVELVRSAHPEVERI